MDNTLKDIKHVAIAHILILSEIIDEPNVKFSDLLSCFNFNNGVFKSERALKDALAELGQAEIIEVDAEAATINSVRIIESVEYEDPDFEMIGYMHSDFADEIGLFEVGDFGVESDIDEKGYEFSSTINEEDTNNPFDLSNADFNNINLETIAETLNLNTGSALESDPIVSGQPEEVNEATSNVEETNVDLNVVDENPNSLNDQQSEKDKGTNEIDDVSLEKVKNLNSTIEENEKTIQNDPSDELEVKLGGDKMAEVNVENVENVKVYTLDDLNMNKMATLKKAISSLVTGYALQGELLVSGEKLNKKELHELVVSKGIKVSLPTFTKWLDIYVESNILFSKAPVNRPFFYVVTENLIGDKLRDKGIAEVERLILRTAEPIFVNPMDYPDTFALEDSDKSTTKSGTAATKSKKAKIEKTKAPTKAKEDVKHSPVDAKVKDIEDKAVEQEPLSAPADDVKQVIDDSVEDSCIDLTDNSPTNDVAGDDKADDKATEKAAMAAFTAFDSPALKEKENKTKSNIIVEDVTKKSNSPMISQDKVEAAVDKSLSALDNNERIASLAAKLLSGLESKENSGNKKAALDLLECVDELLKENEEQKALLSFNLGDLLRFLKK